MRLLLTIPLGLAVVLAAGCTAEETDPQPPAAPAASETAPDPHDHDHEPEPAPEAAAQETAAAFLAAYLDAELAQSDLDAWLAALEAHTHGPYLESLATVDPTRLYADTLSSGLTEVATDRDDTAAFAATGDSGAVWRVELFAGDGRWLVHSVSREAGA